MTTTRTGGGSSRRLLAIVLAVGLGLACAPVAFQMFTRAPKGGDMLDDFAPYMTIEEVSAFRARLDEIDAARAEAVASLPVGELPAVSALDAQWSGIDADMGDMLDSMEENLQEYSGVAALPPFVLFPWFFVLPGVFLAAVAGLSLAGVLGGTVTRRLLLALGIGLLAAPAVFQMFGRAPGGERMIDAFRPMMTEQRVTAVQGYFLTIGSAEGELRRAVVPTVDAGSLPAVEHFVADWPSMSADMAPMIGTMSDNVDNFAAVAALPPFGLFPWFFVLPGLVVLGIAVADGRRRLTLVPTREPLEGATP